MVVACLALFVASTGTSIAASHYLITSTKQIKPSVIKALKGAKGPRGQSVTGLTGAQGPKGDTGATGAAGATGAQGSSGIVTTGVFNSSSDTTVPGNVSAYVFVGNTATVTTTVGQRLTGAAEVPLYSALSASGQSFDYGLCYQPSTGGTISNFAGSNYSTSNVYPDERTFAASASLVFGAGTWNVGFCVRNENSNSIASDWGNGWVQVTN
jgi:hypothetical protein